MPDPKAVLEQAIALTDKAIAGGIAVKTALQAFYDSLYPTFASAGDGVGAMGSLPVDFQNEVLDAVEACKA